jgi:glycosyltransferase involved in cell wall biosynthesis
VTNDIALVYPSIIGSSGTKSYVENTMSGLKKIGIHFQSIPISKREVSIMGKPYFGIILQYLSSLTKSSVESVVHSLSPDVVIKGTNIVTVHDIIPFTNPELYMKSAYDRLAYKFSFSRALKVNTILTSTEFGKKVLTQNTMIREERIRVVHHSIDHSKFFPASEDPFRDHKKINLVMVSDFNPRKRIDKVIEAIGGDDEIDFYHIGPSQGWSDNYNALLHKSKNFRNIRFMGQMNSSELHF